MRLHHAGGLSLRSGARRRGPESRELPLAGPLALLGARSSRLRGVRRRTLAARLRLCRCCLLLCRDCRRESRWVRGDVRLPFKGAGVAGASRPLTSLGKHLQESQERKGDQEKANHILHGGDRGAWKGREVGSPRNGHQDPPPSPLGGSLDVPSTNASQTKGAPISASPEVLLRAAALRVGHDPWEGGCAVGPKGLACTPSLTAP